MNLLSVENISKSYGEHVLFEDIAFGINKGQKIALIAKNGSGKTSILNILSGDDASDAGQVNYRKGIRVSFLSQEPMLDPNLTIEETIFASDNELLRAITSYEKALANPDDQDAYQKAFEEMERYDAWDFETQYKQILSKLKLDDIHLKISILSGGQKKRLALANALINKPDLLILDEPTNHLDLEMIEWLEQYFAKENMTLFMVTHDRYFLERVCNEIIELDNGKLYPYKGNYSYYLEKKEARIEQEAVEHHKSKLLFKKELTWMRRQPKARTTKSKSRIDDFHAIKEKASQRRNDHQIQLEINMERMGSKILELHKISKSYPGKPILDKFEYNFLRGERIGIIGKNGAGKTTLLNMMVGKEEVDGGKIVVGDTIVIGYYTQSGMKLKEDHRVIDVIRNIAEFIPMHKGQKLSAVQLCERFLFDAKKQQTFVSKLSGGERRRLYLLTIIMKNPNFLILDEPTNDLDIMTLQVLEEFLQSFPGCIVIVSHDRHFMDKIVEHTFVLEGDGLVRDFPGNYSAYRAVAKQEAIEAKAEEKVLTADQPEVKTASKISQEERKEIKRLERQISKLEEQKTKITAQFNDMSLTPDQITELSKKLNQLNEDLEEKEMRWMELVDELG